MSVRIRLRRVGRKAQPYYRVVVADSATPRDGHYLDTVGTYNPRTNPAELRMDLGKVDEWVAKGADLSQTVASLVRKARNGGDGKVALMAADAPPAPSRPVAVSAPAIEPVAVSAPAIEPAADAVPAETAAPAELAPEAESAETPAVEPEGA